MSPQGVVAGASTELSSFSNSFIESLSRCEDLNTSGGKSSAAFWTTADRRFLLKELVSDDDARRPLGSDPRSRQQVTAYGVSERDSFLNFAPQLLEYLMHPERPSLLAKIVGFYSLKISIGKETRRLDLIVMENILYGRSESLRPPNDGIPPV